MINQKDEVVPNPLTSVRAGDWERDDKAKRLCQLGFMKIHEN